MLNEDSDLISLDEEPEVQVTTIGLGEEHAGDVITLDEPEPDVESGAEKTDVIHVDEIQLFENEVAATAMVESPTKKQLETPCVVIKNVMLDQEIVYLQSKVSNDETSVALYVEFEGENIKIGRIDLTMDNLLSLSTLLKYEMSLHLPDGRIADLNDPQILMNFIRI
jgi:hypothetical protein